MSKISLSKNWITKRLLQKLVAILFIGTFLGIIISIAFCAFTGVITVEGKLDVKDIWLPVWTLFVALVSMIVTKWLFAVAHEEALETVERTRA